jgi:hypothetical protein
MPRSIRRYAPYAAGLGAGRHADTATEASAPVSAIVLLVEIPNQSQRR